MTDSSLGGRERGARGEKTPRLSKDTEGKQSLASSDQEEIRRRKQNKGKDQRFWQYTEKKLHPTKEEKNPNKDVAFFYVYFLPRERKGEGIREFRSESMQSLWGQKGG